MFDDLFNAGKAYARRRLFRAAFKLLAPFLPYILIGLAVFVVIALLVAAVYASMSPLRALAWVEPSPQDEEIYRQYQELCSRVNVADTWVVNEEPATPEGGRDYESSPAGPFYPGKGVENLHTLADRYGNDRKLALKWGLVHSASLYWTFINNEDAIPETIKNKVAEDLHPYFYYKRSQVITSSTGEDGESETSTQMVYLLVEAYTVEGHYQYHYQWVTRMYGEGKNTVTVTYEELKDTQQILLNPYQRLDDYLKRFYKIPNASIVTDRTAVYEAGKGFDNKQEWLVWLLGRGENIRNYISGAMVPPELVPYFREAEARYGIPWWFLAAVAMQESSFDPRAKNLATGCYGLMQISPENWAARAPRLGFDPVLDRDNPRAQIIVGAYMLSELGLKNIDWQGSNWLEEALPVLAFYGGFRGKDALERCYNDYVLPIWDKAVRFRNYIATWPVPSSHTIVDTYHPVATWLERAHHGIDIAAAMGAAVISVSSGRVVYTGYDAIYGNRIDITDGIHLYRYAHLSRVDVREGDMVVPGQGIGLVGSTGRSTGPHLHFEVHELPGGGTIDPMLVLVQ